jgi:putative DNA primase/helicase
LDASNIHKLIELQSAGELPAHAEDSIALAFADKYEPDLRYVHKWGQWLRYNGTHWSFDETKHVFDLVRNLCREIALDADKPISAIATAKMVAAVQCMVEADRRIAATVSQWDADLWLLNTANGIVDLRDGNLQPHDPLAYMTKVTAVGPDKDCPITTWLRFLERVTGGDSELVAFLQRVAGYGLTGSTQEHALFFHHGVGANGKSTFLNVIAGIMADYHRVAPMDTFIASHYEQHPTDMAGLHGARLVTAVETEEGRRWNESKLKTLTGGDPVTARFMRQDFFTFVPQFKLNVAGNHKPALRSIDEAIKRRLYLIPWNIVIPADERDKRLGDKLRAEWPGILAWIIQGCLRWQAIGLAPPEAVTSATELYMENQNAFAAWIEDYCFLDPNVWESTSVLFDGWKAWCERNGAWIGDVRSFTEMLETRGSVLGVVYQRRVVRGRKHRGFRGLRLTGDAYAKGGDVV